MSPPDDDRFDAVLGGRRGHVTVEQSRADRERRAQEREQQRQHQREELAARIKEATAAHARWQQMAADAQADLDDWDFSLLSAADYEQRKRDLDQAREHALNARELAGALQTELASLSEPNARDE